MSHCKHQPIRITWCLQSTAPIQIRSGRLLRGPPPAQVFRYWLLFHPVDIQSTIYNVQFQYQSVYLGKTYQQDVWASRGSSSTTDAQNMFAHSWNERLKYIFLARRLLSYDFRSCGIVFTFKSDCITFLLFDCYFGPAPFLPDSPATWPVPLPCGVHQRYPMNSSIRAETVLRDPSRDK